MGFIVNTCIEVYKRLKRRLTPQLRHSLRWLDAGCGHGIFPDLIKERGGSLWLTQWPPLRPLTSYLVVVLEKRAVAVAQPLKTADTQAGRPAA